jgi:hypothetical protein
MWKTDLTVKFKRLVFHRGCGNGCGKLMLIVEKDEANSDFHISTGRF